MQFLPIIFAVVVCVLAITLIVVAISIIRVLTQLIRFLKALNTVVDSSQVSLKEMVQEIFTQLLNKVELREELIEDLAIRSTTTAKKSTKKKSEPKQLFRGL